MVVGTVIVLGLIILLIAVSLCVIFFEKVSDHAYPEVCLLCCSWNFQCSFHCSLHEFDEPSIYIGFWAKLVVVFH